MFKTVQCVKRNLGNIKREKGRGLGTLADDGDNAQAHVCVVRFPRKKKKIKTFLT